MTDVDELHGLAAGPGRTAGQAHVTAHRSDPETTVFTEEGNTDGWIASDTTMDLDR